MAELPEGQKQAGKPVTREEPGMEKRLLLAFLLMGAILYLTPYFYRQFAPPPAPKPAQATPPVAKPAPEKAPPPAPVALRKPVPAAPLSAAKEETFTVETSLYRVQLSNQGAVVRSWVLKKYKDSAGKPLELVNGAGAAKVGFPFSLAVKDKNLSPDLSQALWAAKPASDGLAIDYHYSDGKLAARKSFRFHPDSYLSEFSSELSEAGAGLPHVVLWRGGFGDPAVANPSASQRALHFDLAANKLLTKDAKAGRDAPVIETGRYSFAGVEDNYFTAVFLPPANTQVEVHTLSDAVPGPLNPKEEPQVGAGVGGAAQNRFSLFVGPKDIDLLRRVDPKLEQVVDWGWFGLLAKPLFLMLNWINDRTVHNYGWAIVVVTIFINFALLPLKLTSMKSMKKMQALQPQLAAINAKYKSIGLRDPRKAQQNQEVMDLYKKHGVNPMGGCIPMLIQIPFFFAFYKVLVVAIEMRGANWLWVTDLSQPEHLPIRILPVAMVVSQFVMQKMTPTATADPMQQKMMLFMPLVFGFMFYQFQSGLVLYWLTSNLVGIAQQWLINKTTAPVLIPQETVKRKKG